MRQYRRGGRKEKAMLWFVCRRSLYSILILLGVVILTFVLFNIAAGDPAGAVLGKNAGVGEVDALRRELGADLPLFYGKYCPTNHYSNYQKNSAMRPGVKLDGGRLTFSANYMSSDPAIAKICRDGGKIELTTVPAGGAFVLADADFIDSVTFYRVQDSAFNSQLFRSVREIVNITGEYPYVTFLNFGKTLTTREPIIEILKRGVWPSLAIMVPIFLGEMIIGLILALIASAFKNTLVDRLLVILSVAGMSISYLVVIIFAQWFLGYYYNLFPVWGWGSINCLFLPVIVGIVSGIGGNVRFYRTVFVNELQKEYLRTAAAKGCSPITIYSKHLLRNAAVQIITRASAALPFLFTGSLLLESFFGIPGLGFAGIDALYNSDLQLLKALVITSALLFVVINLLADLAYAWADPRIRLE